MSELGAGRGLCDALSLQLFLCSHSPQCNGDVTLPALWGKSLSSLSCDLHPVDVLRQNPGLQPHELLPRGTDSAFLKGKPGGSSEEFTLLGRLRLLSDLFLRATLGGGWVLFVCLFIMDDDTEVPRGLVRS